ncbi:MAG: GrpB family protein [Fimbriimonas sp.]
MAGPIELHPHSDTWASGARALIAQVATILGEIVVASHHIGSTSIPGIRAKPILDVMLLVSDLGLVDQMRREMREAGFEPRGEQGISGRRYFVQADAATGARLAHIHVYEVDSPEVERHLAFRDYLRAHPDRAQAYEAEKLRCQTLHPTEKNAYAQAKDAWIRAEETDAIAWARDRK